MKLFLLIVLYLFLNSCREKIQTEVISAKLTHDVYPDTIWFSECDIIFPETTEQSLISLINKIVITPGRIFIHDIRDQKLLLFSRQGKFIRGIHPQGRGNGEWTGMTDFTVDETKQEIIIAADRPYKFLYYNYAGNFLREKTSETFYIGITQTDNHILAVNARTTDPKHYLSLLKENEDRMITDERIPLEYVYYGDFRCRGSYLLKSKHLHFTQNGDYKIYRWENNKIKPLFEVDFGKYNYSPELLKKEPDSPRTQNKILSIINVKETDKYLFFNTNKTGIFVYDNTSHQITYADMIRHTDLGINLWNHIATEDLNHEIIAYSCDIRQLQRKLFTVNSELPIVKRIKEAEEDDNPVLFLYKSK